jgi:site-specific DNA-methyltransferase (adenine-specific)
MSNPEMFRYEMVWEKSRMTDFFQAKFKPMKTHENILVFYKHIPTYNPIKWKIDDRFIDRRKTFTEHIETGMFIGNKKTHKKDDGMRNPMTIISIKSENTEKTKHSTQKPVALFEYLIKTYTNEGDLVLDNCAGSGTTGVACKNLNRNFILIEKESEYIDIINKRLDNSAMWKTICYHNLISANHLNK